MPRQPSFPDRDAESIPPPSGTDVESRLGWCVEVLTGPHRHVLKRLAALEDSLGREGNAAKGRAATGLHLGVEQLASGLDRVEEALVKVVDRLDAISLAQSKRADWTTWATRVVLGALILAIVGGLVAIVVSGARVQMAPAGVAAPPR